MKKKFSAILTVLVMLTVIIAGTVYAATNVSLSGKDIMSNDTNDDEDSDKTAGNESSSENLPAMEYWDEQDEIPAINGATCDIFLNLTGIQGSSTSARHLNQINVMSYSFGAHRDSSNIVHKVFRIYKKTDVSSPKLYQAMIDGNNISSAVFDTVKAGSSQEMTTKITLSNVGIVSYKQYTSSSNTGYEEVLLSYTDIDYAYYKYNSNGTSAGTIHASSSVD